MNERELEEGMTLEELFQVLKEKKEVEMETRGKGVDEVMDENEAGHHTRYDKEMAFTWIDLLLLLIDKRFFFSLRKDPEGRVSILKEKSSKRVLDYFFENAWGKTIQRN